jgi:putative addiction module component (TIGR02574 family)
MENVPMTKHASQLLEQALRLPEGERADFAAQLLDSLDPTAEDDVEAAWSKEILERLQDLDSGKEKPIPWSEARRMILEPSDDASEP